MNNQIYFNVKDNKVTVKSRGPMTLDDLLQVTATGILGAMLSLVDHTPEEQREECINALFDRYNQVASRTLELFAPNLELRPDLTTQAIMEAEDNIIEKEFQSKKGRLERETNLGFSSKRKLGPRPESPQKDNVSFLPIRE